MSGFFDFGIDRDSIEQSRLFAAQTFRSIESQLGDLLPAYQVFQLHSEGFWQTVDYEELKQSVLDSHIIARDEQRPSTHIGRRVAFLIDADKKELYLNVTLRNVDPHQIDWRQIKKFEAWSNAETKVDKAIADYRRKLRSQRQGKPAPRWWEFWLIK